MALSNKQKRFCEEYIVDRNATKAALRAGYAKHTAEHAYAWINPKRVDKFNPELRAYIDEMEEQIKAETIADAIEIRQFLTSTMRNERVDNVVVMSGDGVQEVICARPSAKDRLKAAELLAKCEGMFDNKLDVSMDTEIRIIRDYGD